MNAPDFTEAFSLRNETVLITGGGTGIGLAAARAMRAAGARVILAGRREGELAAAVDSLGPGSAYVVHDVTRLDAADALAGRVAAEHGPISCLVNNAGIHLKKPAVETTAGEFQSVINTHVLGAHALCCAVVPGMIERGHGSVIFMASMASMFGIPGVVAYSAAKSAVLGMVRTMATELSPHGVRVNAIAPGWIETAMSLRALSGDPARRDRILSRTPMGRLGSPADIGWAAVYLASPAAGFVTGAILPVDGGASIGF